MSADRDRLPIFSDRGARASFIRIFYGEIVGSPREESPCPPPPPPPRFRQPRINCFREWRQVRRARPDKREGQRFFSDGPSPFSVFSFLEMPGYSFFILLPFPLFHFPQIIIISQFLSAPMFSPWWRGNDDESSLDAPPLFFEGLFFLRFSPSAESTPRKCSSSSLGLSIFDPQLRSVVTLRRPRS